jgi:hypothetical protein
MMLLHETLHTELNLRRTTSRIFEILYGGLGYQRVRFLLTAFFEVRFLTLFLFSGAGRK